MYRESYIEELNKHFGSDQRRINHALMVLGYADSIMDGEAVGPDLRKVITITALLHDVGIKSAEQKYNSAAGKYQELEGPAIVREILYRQGEPQELVERVAYIVGGHHTAAKNDGLDFQIIWEADLLVNIEEDGIAKQCSDMKKIIKRNFRTATGIRIAEERYL